MNFKKIIGLLIILNVMHVSAENITYKDDFYSEQARPELISLIDQVAQDIDFAGDYEAVESKKAGLLINPWNRMMGYGVNQQTKENFIVINHDWFKNLSKDEQSFLIARVLVKFEKGSQPIILKIIVVLFGLIFWLLIALFFWLINKTRFQNKNKWLKILFAWLLAAVCNVLFVLKLQQVALDYANFRYEKSINKVALDKLQNQEAAVHALELMHETIQEGIKNGETAYLPQAETFSKFAKALSR